MATGRKTSLLIVLIMIFTMVLSACGGQSAEEQAEPEGLRIYTSIYPLYDFSSKITGEKAEVVNLVPPGAEPHDFEPSPKDLVKLSEADVFVYNGGGFETWIEDVLQSIDTSGMIVVNASEEIEPMEREDIVHRVGHADEHAEDGEHEEEAHEEEADEHNHGIYDPHFWTDPLRAKAIATAIKDAVIEADPANQAVYEQNYEDLMQEFDRLHQEYEETLKNATRKDFIVSHAAFGYLAERYGLEQIAISGLSPSDEPSQKELQEIIDFARENQVEYIMFENLVDTRVAQMVREQIGAEALVLHTVGGLTKEELERGEDYFSLMRQNLKSLSKALGVESK
ncbi:MAG: zinc ABC transporter substrate-binding protein [Bacillaceae bacterium]|nr:zinc ABC transporter substrate-binding protein [Bacillaceae bacterium]